LGPFWTGQKRFPSVAELDLQNELHVDYLFSASNLFAFMFKIPSVTRSDFEQLLAGMDLSVAPWAAPKDAVDISEGKDEKKGMMQEDPQELAVYADIKARLLAVKAASPPALQAADFEKDDDTNFHIDFITGCSNLRAWNYRIQPCSRLKAKVIAGKIIAALASTTAMISGLCSMEYYKLALGLRKDEKTNPFFDSNINLGVSQYQLFNSPEAKRTVGGFDVTMQCVVNTVPAEGFTNWEYVVIDQGDLTLRQFLKAFTESWHGCTIEVLNKYKITQAEIDANKTAALYEDCKSTHKARLDRKVADLYADIYYPEHGIPSSKNFILLAGEVANVDGEGVSIPTIKYVFRH